MANKGAINLVATKAAMQQAIELERNLKKVEDRIISISKEIRKMQNAFKSVDSKISLSDEVDKLKKKIDSLEKAERKWKTTQKQLEAQIKKSTTGLKKYNTETKNTSRATSTATVRVKSFFKTLVAFDIARRLVDGFWNSFKKGFQTLKTLDSLRLQFQFVVGDMEEVAQTQAFLSRISNQYGADLLVLSERYIKFRAATKQTNISALETMRIYESLTKAAGVLGLKTHELQGIFLAVEQMVSKGKITTEELRRQLGERLPGAFQIMADAVGVSTQKLDDMLRKGEILSEEFLPKFATALEQAYGIEHVRNINTLQAATVRFDNAFTRLVENMEGGESRISKVFIKLLDIATVLTDAFGELFLSQDQLDKANRTLGESEGLSEATKKFNALKKSSKDFNKDIQKELKFSTIEMLRLKDEVAKLDIELKKSQTNNFGPKERVRSETAILGLRNQYLKALGFEEGIIKGINQLLEEQDKKTKDIVESRSKVSQGFVAKVESDAFIFQLEEAIKKLTQLRQASSDPIEIRIFNESLEKANGLLRILKGEEVGASIAAKELEEWTKKVAKEIDDLARKAKKAADATKKFGDDAEKTAKEKLRKFVDTLEIFGESLRAIADVADAIFERSIVRLETELDLIERNYNRQRELIEAEVGDKEAKEERLRQLDKEREIAEEKVNKRIREEKKKQFIANKAAALAEIAINTAVWVTQVGKQTGLFGIALAPLIIALGAIQAAAVLAQPVPNFKEGHLSGTHEGLANTNDGPDQEFIERDGKVVPIQGKNTKIMMKKGDKIHKNLQSVFDNSPKSMLINSIKKAAIMTSLDSEMNLLNRISPEKSFDDNFKEALKRDIVKSLSGIVIKNNDRGVAEAVSKVLKENNYIKNLHRS